MIGISHSGDFKFLESFLKRGIKPGYIEKLHRYGRQGVIMLSNATPRSTGQTALSWSYEIIVGKNTVSINWINDNISPGGPPVAILLQYGHATRNGGYVIGRDFINPTMRHILDDMANTIWKEVVDG